MQSKKFDFRVYQLALQHIFEKLMDSYREYYRDWQYWKDPADLVELRKCVVDINLIKTILKSIENDDKGETN